MTNDNSKALANLPQRSPLSIQERIALCEQRLQPVTQRAGTAELLACLTLVAPTGMSAEDRTAWVAVARETLSGIPADLLQRGCWKARRTCKFPSEIVPTILSCTEKEWRARRIDMSNAIAARDRKPAEQIEYIGPQDMAALIKRIAA